MPEFQEESIESSQNVDYTPRENASKKLRNGREARFKEATARPTAENPGEVSSRESLKKEKPHSPAPLTGADQSEVSDASEKKHSLSRRKPHSSNKTGEVSRKRESQPSEKTLAAIARVESRVARRRAERQKNRSSRDSDQRRSASQTQTRKKGWFASILSMLGFGPSSEPEPKVGHKRSRRNRRPGERSRNDRSRRRSQRRSDDPNKKTGS